ncbi:MAG: hypothetical protein OHK0017_05200 [Patescibacteria group bacterium]
MTSDKFLEKYNRLNPEQRLVVDTIEGPVLVVAGAGTGKTEVLSLRVANILQQTDTPPNAILCITFTDSAARNMRERLWKMIGTAAQKIHIHTFHSLGAEIINQNPEYFFDGAEYKVADDLAKIEILEKILTSLPNNNPLKSYHPEEGWTYRRDILDRIRDLKQDGLTPTQFKQLLEIDYEFIGQVQPVFQQIFEVPNMRAFKLEDLKQFTNNLQELYADFQVKYENLETMNRIMGVKGQADNSVTELIFPFKYQFWAKKFLASLAELWQIIDSQEKWSSTPVTSWKNEWGKKDDYNRLFLKDCMNYSKYSALAEIYEYYQVEMHRSKLYDFDDMLLQVVEAFRQHPSLRYNYQEKYLYLLVDEFQDTNGVQMSLVDSFINLEISDASPNICAVGDDDQAIYKFQKATLENIQSFREKYSGVKIITLKQNYRSRQDILDLAMQVISQSGTRLAHWPEVDKVLRAAN